MKIEIHCISEFLNVMSKFKVQFSQTQNNSGFIFRGMSNESWELIPGIFRKRHEEQGSSSVERSSYSIKIYPAYEFEILSHFRKESSSLLPHISQKDDFTWLQYAQHYGVPTRLLDFTANPLVALFFCCQSESKCNGAVWIINTVTFQNWSENETICFDMGPDYTPDAIINSIMKELHGDFDYDELQGEPRSKKQRPVYFVPSYIDQRMSAQSSRFLLWGNKEIELEKMISKENWMYLLSNDHKNNPENEQRFLSKIIIPSFCKHSIMQELDLLNINEKSVFPGLDGIGKYINKYYEKNFDDICEFL